MKGYLLIFRPKDTKDAVKLNHKVLGRIISRRDASGSIQRFYNKGALDMVPHKRLSNGCYFSKGDLPFEDDRIVKLKADVSMREAELKTGRGFWKTHAYKKRYDVRNL